MEEARDIAEHMSKSGRGIILNQFSNSDNPLAHYESTAPEIWNDTRGKITHFVSSMGTTGTCLLYTSPSPRDRTRSRMPSSA